MSEEIGLIFFWSFVIVLLLLFAWGILEAYLYIRKIRRIKKEMEKYAKIMGVDLEKLDKGVYFNE